MAEASFASLSPKLLARKGGAKPAMRPQHAARWIFHCDVHHRPARGLIVREDGIGDGSPRGV